MNLSSEDALRCLEAVKPSAAFPAEDIADAKVRLSTAAPEESAQILDAFLSGRKPLASFHLLSDTHYSCEPERAGLVENVLRNAESVMPETNIATVICGDLTNGGAAEHYDGLYRMLAEHGLSHESTLLLLGNHDVRGNNVLLWNKNPNKKCPYWDTAKKLYLDHNTPYMPENSKLYFSRELGGYTFLMLNTMLGLKDAPYIPAEEQQWLEESLRACYEKDPEKPVFIICHQPLNNTHWMSNTLDGFDGLDNSKGCGPEGAPLPYCTGADAAVKKILAKYPVAVFLSGHIHTPMQICELQPRAYAAAMDVPCAIKSEPGSGVKGMGYEVALYENEIVFRARSFDEGRWLPQYDRILPLPMPHTVYQAALARKEAGTASPALLEAAEACGKLMARTYDQEGIPWDWDGFPDAELFDDDTLGTIRGLCETMRREMK